MLERQYQVAGWIHGSIFVYEIIDYPSREEVLEIYQKDYFLMDCDGTILKATDFYSFEDFEQEEVK